MGGGGEEMERGRIVGGWKTVVKEGMLGLGRDATSSQHPARTNMISNGTQSISIIGG